jgi:hypothetical protein
MMPPLKSSTKWPYSCAMTVSIALLLQPPPDLKKLMLRAPGS